MSKIILIPKFQYKKYTINFNIFNKNIIMHLEVSFLFTSLLFKYSKFLKYKSKILNVSKNIFKI